MSKVNQCDRCKTIFEPEVAKNGELHITRSGWDGEIDLCPECYEYLLKFLKKDIDEYKCATCKFKAKKSTDDPCRTCCYSWDSNYEKEAEK